MGVCRALIASAAPERQQSRGGSRASSGPSLSLPVPDSARSAREGSLPSFSRKCCRKILNQSALLEQAEQGQEEQLQAASGALLCPLAVVLVLLRWPPVQIAHRHQCLSSVDYDLFVIIRRQELEPQRCQCNCCHPLWGSCSTALPSEVFCAGKGCPGMFC